MKGVLLKDDELIDIFDHIDEDRIGIEFLHCGVNLRTYRNFIAGRGNYIFSADNKIELREVYEEDLKRMIESRIEKVKKELNWLYAEESKLEDDEQEGV